MATRELEAQLIASYRASASARRRKSTLNQAATQPDPNITKSNGVITVDLSGAKPISGVSERQRIFGQSRITIPEFHNHRK